MYKPKSTKDIYADSLSINSESLEKQLIEQAVPSTEIRDIIQIVSKQYNERVKQIVEECERNMMALEHVPSPLKLFIVCLTQVYNSISLSPQTRMLIHQYANAWEDWM
jgi:hypothetical protein